MNLQVRSLVRETKSESSWWCRQSSADFSLDLWAVPSIRHCCRKTCCISQVSTTDLLHHFLLHQICLDSLMNQTSVTASSAAAAICLCSSSKVCWFVQQLTIFGGPSLTNLYYRSPASHLSFPSGPPKIPPKARSKKRIWHGELWSKAKVPNWRQLLLLPGK